MLSTALRVLSGIARRPQTVLKLDVLILGSAELSPTRTRLKPRTVTITPISAWLDVEWALEHTLGSNALLAQPSATRVISVCVPSGDYTQRGLVSALHAACVNQVQNSPIGGLPFAAKVPPPPPPASFLSCKFLSHIPRARMGWMVPHSRHPTRLYLPRDSLLCGEQMQVTYSPAHGGCIVVAPQPKVFPARNGESIRQRSGMTADTHARGRCGTKQLQASLHIRLLFRSGPNADRSLCIALGAVGQGKLREGPPDTVVAHSALMSEAYASSVQRYDRVLLSHEFCLAVGNDTGTVFTFRRGRLSTSFRSFRLSLRMESPKRSGWAPLQFCGCCRVSSAPP